MSALLPLASYNLELQPFAPQPCQTEDFPITVRLTLASIDPEPVDTKKEPSTLRILKKSPVFSGEADDDDEDEDEDDEDDESDEEMEDDNENTKGKQNSESEGDSDDDDDDEIEDDEAIEEHVICTLSPSTQFQQTLDLTILPDEEVFFVVTGSYTVHLTGNYVEHPNDEDEDDYIYGDGSDDEYDDDEYDLTPDEDEIYDLDDLNNVDDIEGKIEELVEDDEKNLKKRESEQADEKETKKQKKEKKEKTVKFNKELEQGPTGPAAEEKKAEKKETKKESKKEEKKESKKEEKKKAEKKEVKKEEKKKPAVKTLPGGVIIEDKTFGTGPVCKKGQKVGVRYIGKLKNGKVFDKNTSGRPFHFGLGKGEVIKGWDIGVAGMAVGGERRIVIPAPMAYGSQKLPGIPANSELIFDVKLLSIK